MRPQSLALELHERMLRLAIGEEDLTAFWDWFMPISWDSACVLDRDTGDIADEVQHLLFELSDALWTLDEVREKIRHMLTTTRLQFPLDDAPWSPQVYTGAYAQSEPIRETLVLESAWSGSRSVTAPA